MKVLFVALFCCCTSTTATYLEDGRRAVEPEYLDKLLEEKRFEEFNQLMGIDIPHLSESRSENDGLRDPRFNPDLHYGDVLLTPQQREVARTAINPVKWPGSYWKAVVPYAVSTQYTARERQSMDSWAERCNRVFPCIRLVPYNGNKDYVFIFPGDGCYSRLGRTGGQQTLSLQKTGCMSYDTFAHEMMHALGIMHEQCRDDRDKYIKMNWDNIQSGWESQFEIYRPDDFILPVPKYDCYSIMHYPAYHPQLCKNMSIPAFSPLDPPNCDIKRIGYSQELTDLDKKTIEYLYCR